MYKIYEEYTITYEEENFETGLYFNGKIFNIKKKDKRIIGKKNKI